MDLLDRMLIISTAPYSVEDIRQILHIRTQEEDVDLAEDALDLLTKIGQETSLRYAMHIIITSHLIAKKRKSPKITVADITRSYKLFLDRKRSVAFVESSSEYVDEKSFAAPTNGEIPMEA